MRVLIQHVSRYRYSRAAVLGPHLLRLKPAAHARARVETYNLLVTGAELRWQQDPAGNFIARATWPNRRVTELEVSVEMAVDIRPVNPFDFTLDQSAESVPLDYGAQRKELEAYTKVDDVGLTLGPKAREFLSGLPKSGPSVSLLVELNRRVKDAVRYIIREETGIWSPEETLAQGRGSCRDSAVLLMAVLRSRGLAARFVSGYLVQLTDEGMIPDEPKGVSRDVVDLHAWTEVFLPGAGWVGLDATSGLFCGEGHIPLACTAQPHLAAPIDGTTDELAREVSFSMQVGRLGHEVRPTSPFTEAVWRELQAAGAATDAKSSASASP